MKIRGRNPSNAQRKTLKRHVDNVDEWLVQKVRLISESEKDSRRRASLSQNDPKIEEWRLIHRGSGEIKVIRHGG